MSQEYAAWEPDAHGHALPGVRVRRAEPRDLSSLAAVMASRGGSPADHQPAAARLLSTAPILVVAEDAGHVRPGIVGWSGATRVPLQPDEPGRWLTTGLTVVPEARRAGIGGRLLSTVAEVVSSRRSGPLHSVVNTRNRA